MNISQAASGLSPRALANDGSSVALRSDAALPHLPRPSSGTSTSVDRLCLPTLVVLAALTPESGYAMKRLAPHPSVACAAATGSLEGDAPERRCTCGSGCESSKRRVLLTLNKQ